MPVRLTYEQALSILGLSADVAGSDVKKAYRQLARKLHPDVNANSDDTERFKRVTEAYEVLMGSAQYTADSSDADAEETVAEATDAASLSALRAGVAAAIADLKQEARTEASARRRASAAALRTSADVLNQTMMEFNEGLARNGWAHASRPVFFVAVERLMADVLKSEMQRDRSAEEYLTRGALGLVGLLRIRQIVPPGARAEAKEAAARAVISAIGQALLRYNLIGMPVELVKADVTGGLAPARRLMLNALSDTESSIRSA